MLAEERRQSILKELKERGSIHVAEISQLFQVTEETIRRDLERLEKENLLKRIHGGAVSLGPKEEPSYFTRKQKNIQEKQRIAEKAMMFIKEGQTLFLDASTTTLYLAREINKMHLQLTVITNSIRNIMELAGSRHVTVLSCGGLLRSNSLSFVGPLANMTLKKYNAHLLFVSCKGISLRHGATEANELELEIKETMMGQTQEVILLADHTKFNQIGLAQFAPIEDLDRIITDSGVEDTIVEEFEKAGKPLLQA